MSFDIGATVAGKYQIQRVLGQGGMGTVYLATHTLLDRSVALKILHPGTFEHPAATERLLREGRALARLRGEHIARVLDVEAPQNGPCFLVLEYLEGEDLGAIIKQSGALPINLAVTYILEACEALAEAHAQGIVHRDIKPSNLFLTPMADGSSGIKVIDFGISKQTDQGTSLTHSRSVIGSPCYMAPEQLRSSGSIDARCDIWSLGVVFYEMLTGKPPHGGNSVLELCASILESDPKSPKALRPEVPHAIDAAVRKCLARDPDERFATVRELSLSIAADPGSTTARLAWNLPSSSEILKASSSRDSTADGQLLPDVTNQTESDHTPPARRGSPAFPAVWILGILLFVLGVSMLLVTNRKQVAVAASAGHAGSVTAMQQERGALTIASIAPHDLRFESPPLELGPTPPALQDSRIPLGRGIRRNVALRDPATKKPQVAESSSAPAPTSQATAAANSIEQDPILKYGHY
jgi:serine/threonine-protein kinase